MIEGIRTVHAWLPLIGYARRYSAAADAGERAIVAADAIEWAASRTAGTLDDRIAKRFAAILRTPEGEALVREIVAIVDSLPQEPVE